MVFVVPVLLVEVHVMLELVEDVLQVSSGRETLQ
jgi:hypothetical protein